MKSGAPRDSLSFLRSIVHMRRPSRCARQHRRCNVFIGHLHSRCRRHEVFVWEIYPTCSQLISIPLGRRPAGRQIRVLRRLPVKLIHGLDCTKAMPTSVPAAPHRTPVSSLRVSQPTMVTNPGMPRRSAALPGSQRRRGASVLPRAAFCCCRRYGSCMALLAHPSIPAPLQDAGQRHLAHHADWRDPLIVGATAVMAMMILAVI